MSDRCESPDLKTSKNSSMTWAVVSCSCDKPRRAHADRWKEQDEVQGSSISIGATISPRPRQTAAGVFRKKVTSLPDLAASVSNRVLGVSDSIGDQGRPEWLPRRSIRPRAQPGLEWS